MKLPKLYLYQIFLWFIAISLVHTGQALAQSVEINISVIDSLTQTALPGVNVTVQGTNRGGSTDGNGQLRLIAATSEVLIFSYIGYLKKEVKAGNSPVMSVLLRPSEQALNELVVVGYGTQKKVNLTGAVSVIDSKVIENRPVSNLASAMQGTTAGLIVTRSSGQPGSENINMQLRGATSANGNVNPLVMLDGVPVPIATLQTMNQNDVESISVLKDAAAAAIYGAQASGGVILVTTKKGKSGKAVIDYSMLIGGNRMQDMPGRMSLMDEALYANLSNKNAGVGPAYDQATLDMIRQGVEYYVNPADTNTYEYLNQKDLVGQIVRKRNIMQTHNLSVRGGTDKLNYLVSLGLMNQKGAFAIGPDQLTRYNARLNLGAELNKYFSLETRLAYTIQKQEAPSQPASTLLTQTFRHRQRWPIFTPEGRLSGAGSSSAILAYAHLSEGGYNNWDNNNLNGMFTVKFANLIKGLEARAILGGQYARDDRNKFNRTVTTWQRFAPVYYLNNPNVYQMDRDVRTSRNMQFLVDYDFKLSDKNLFHVLIGSQFDDYRFSSVFTTSRSLASNDLPALNLGDDATKTNGQLIDTYANLSYFSRLNYSYDERYLFEATIRMDQSSRLAPGMRTKIFPSLSAGWNVNQEKWFPVTNLVSGLKLRASWGQLGSSLSEIIGNYDYLNMLTRGNELVLGSGRAMYFYQKVVPSSQLTWETVETSNAGLDFGLFKNRLLVSADYYIKFNRNMLTPQLLPAAFGVETPRKNNGELKSWGWELEASYRDRIGSNFSYNIGINLSDNQNKLISYAGQKVISAGIVNILEGYPINSIWGYKTDGYFQSADQVTNAAFQNALTGIGDVKYVDLNADKQISVGKATPEDHGDLVYLGADQPRLTFGINAGMQWKDFDFSVFFQGVGKRTFYPNIGFVNPQDAGWNQPMTFHSDFWTEDNRNAYFPRPYLGGGRNYLYSDKWVLNGRYIRLKNIQIGYNLATSIAQKIKISRARLFLSGQDLLTFSGLGIFKSSFSPEFTNNTGFQYPLYSNVSAGLNLTL